MKKIYLLLTFLLSAFFAHAQLNMALRSHLTYGADLNDIWGWVDEDGTEYAIVGLVNGVSIVSLADPDNAEEVVFIPGQNSLWRDIKTWGNHAYVTTDQSGTTEGLLVIDLSQLPEAAPYYHWNPDLPELGVLNTCHNLYIDEFGYCYLSGCNVNNGGVLFIDVATTPGAPIYVNKCAARYSHDSYARNNILYSSEILGGTLGIYDVLNKANPVLLAAQTTPSAFTHNAWLSDDGNVVFTTDERANAPIAAYDISDLSDIQELDQFRPVSTLGNGVIPHNVHVWNDWLIISYYTDGGVVVDASRPENLIEVGNFDSFFGAGTGFYGAWGAYPFLPSGLVLISDINSGLYVLTPNYVRACFLEGQVTSAVTGQPLGDVEVVIQSTQANLGETNNFGEYKTGQAIPGTFTVRFTKLGYYPVEAEAVLENGEVTIVDVQMTPLATYSVSGFSIQDEDGQPVPNAKISFVSETATYTTTSDNNGVFSIATAYEGQYTIYAGVWGRLHAVLENVVINATTDQLVVPLKVGYQDDFLFELGWEKTADANANAGFWVRAVPILTANNGEASNPGSDVADDLGTECYVTGNAAGNVGAADVDGGRVYLTSPVMDFSDYQDPVISYNLWFYNSGGNSTPDDSLVVRLSNGLQSIVLETVKESSSVWRPRSEFHLAPLIELTENMQVTYETGDVNANPHLVEGGVDAFLVVDAFVNDTDENLPVVNAGLMPNPFSGATQFRYHFDNPIEGIVTVTVFDVLGRPLERKVVNDQEGTIQVGQNLPAGYFFATLSLNGEPLKTFRMVKVE